MRSSSYKKVESKYRACTELLKVLLRFNPKLGFTAAQYNKWRYRRTGW